MAAQLPGFSIKNLFFQLYSRGGNAENRRPDGKRKEYCAACEDPQGQNVIVPCKDI